MGILRGFLYSYCNGNPVMFAEPLGFRMRFLSLDEANLAIAAMNQMCGYNANNGYSTAEICDIAGAV